MNILALLAAFLPLPVATAPAAAAAGADRVTAAFARQRVAAGVVREFVRIPAGEYVPFYGDGTPDRIESFDLDRYPVTQHDYLAFVTAHPQWQSGRIKAVVADRGYLRDWPAPLQPSEAAAPVVNVSWFAARAYCGASGGRLPTTAEWEYIGAASEGERDASRDDRFRARMLDLYTRARPDVLPRTGSGMRNWYGIHDMHGFVREWVVDFNNVMVSDDSRGTGGSDRELYCAAAASTARDPSDYAAFLRYALRASLTSRSTQSNLGFRCARSIS